MAKLIRLRNWGRVRHDGGVSHKSGYDLTFAVPKSVSMLALITGDNRLLQLHRRAVDTALAFVQQEAARTRTSTGGVTAFENAQNLVVAQFTHDTARGITDQDAITIDCHLHTHSVVMNMIQCADGKWRSLAEKKLYQLMKTAGLVYRNALAEYIQHQTGYSLKKTREDGLFEIKGLSRAHIEKFSNRVLSVEALKKEIGVEGYLGGKKIAEITRESKKPIDQIWLKQHWQSRTEKADIPLQALYQDSLDSAAHRDNTAIEKNARLAVQYAIDHLSERKAVFSRYELLQVALGEYVIDTTLEAIETMIDQYIDKKNLIYVDDDAFSTQANLNKEREIIAMIKAGKNTLPPIANVDTVDCYLQQLSSSDTLHSDSPPPLSLTIGQQRAIRMLLTNSDRFVGIQGFAGTGKTTFLRDAVTFMEKAAIEIQGIAPTAAAVRNLHQTIGKPARTVSDFLAKNKFLKKTVANPDADKPSPQKKRSKLLLVDEASMLSTPQWYQLQKIALRDDYRVVYLGDQLQFHAIGEGNPFGSLQDNGMQTTTIKELVRQTDSAQRLAVKKTIVGDIQGAFLKIGHRITAIEDKQARIRYLIEKYLALDEATRRNTIMAVVTHDDRALINQQLRERLAPPLAEHPEQTFRTLHNKSLTRAQKRRISHYKLGDVIRFNRRHHKQGIKSGEHFTVTAIDDNTHTLQLTRDSQQGGIIFWKPEQLDKRDDRTEVFSAEEKGLRQGDYLRFTRAIKSHGIINTDTAYVLEVTAKHAKIKWMMDVSSP